VKANYTRFAAPFALGSAVQYLIVANFVVFGLELIGSPQHLILTFGLRPYEVVYQGAIWQLVTSMFLHGGLMHIGINLLVLWFIGPPVERVWGMKRFFIYYFVSGIGANLITILIAFTWAPAMIYGVSIGASGAIYGVLLAFGLLFPEQMVYIYFLFPMKAKYFVILAAALAFFSEAGNLTPGINNWAHLGGMLFGLVYLKGRGWLRQLSSRLGG